MSGGRIPANRRASIVLPDPGGPTIRTLCPPAAATSSARLAVVCPRTSPKSGRGSLEADAPAAGLGSEGANSSGRLSRLTTSARCLSPNTRTPSTTAASAALLCGTMTFEIPIRRAHTAIERVPRTGRSEPSSDSSPTNRNGPVGCTTPMAPRMPSAIGRSKPAPSFRRFAGARLIVTERLG